MWGEVVDYSPKEGRRVLLHKLPQFLLRWIVEEKDRKMTTRPVVIVNSHNPQVNGAGEMASVDKRKPIQISKTSEGDFEMTLSDKADCERLMAFHGKVFTGARTMLQIK